MESVKVGGFRLLANFLHEIIELGKVKATLHMDLVESAEDFTQRCLYKVCELAVFLKKLKFALSWRIDWPMEADTACAWHQVVASRSQINIDHCLSLVTQRQSSYKFELS